MKWQVGAAAPGVVRHICKCSMFCVLLGDIGCELIEADHHAVANKRLVDMIQKRGIHSCDFFSGHEGKGKHGEQSGRCLGEGE